METSHKILLIAAVLAISYLAMKKLHKKEPYQDIFMAKDIPNDEIIMRPSYSAQLAPRMDPFRNGAYNKLNGYLPNISEQATPVNPLGNGSFPINGSKVDYSQLGNSTEIAMAEQECASAKLKKFESINKPTSEKFSMNVDGSSPMNSSQLEYLDPSSLLPQPDMASILTKDPTDPNVFQYDRTLFAPLKRRNLNNVDFIRGDLPIAMDKRGYFDVAANPGTDLVIGSAAMIAPDMQEQTMMQDLVYTRYDHEYPLQSKVVSGDLQNRLP